MLPVYLKELKKYSFSDLLNLSQLSAKDLGSFLSKAIEAGIVKKKVKKSTSFFLSDIFDFDEYVSDEADVGTVYSFQYVGILHYHGKLIIVYPKYFSKIPSIASIKQILAIISKYRNNIHSLVRIKGGTVDSGCISSLSLYLFLLSDFQQHGAYSTTDVRIIENGDGFILWDKTINEKSPYFQNNKPIYVDFYARQHIDDDNNFFTLLHQSVVASCSKALEKVGVLELFGLTPCYPSEEEIDSFGDSEYIQYRLQCELSEQFGSRNRMILHTIMAYIGKHSKEEYESNDKLDLYGTTSFHQLWEQVCASVFDNELNTPLKNNRLLSSSDPRTLLEIIEKPIWAAYNSDRTIAYRHEARETLTPDLAKLFKTESGIVLAIFDAKYYCIQIREDKLDNHPGVGDVTKQHLYQLAYRDLLLKEGISYITNSFLLPSETNDLTCMGETSMRMLTNIGLEPIRLYMIPASYVFEKYLKNEKLGLSFFNMEG